MSKVFISLISAAFLLSIWGLAIEPGLLTQKDLTLPEWKGPKIRIAFLSDLHGGAPHINEKYIENLIERINKMSPDIVLIGGDLVINGVVGGTHMPIEKITDLFKNLKAPNGIYAVLGNHDWWNDGDHITKELENIGIQVLENKAIQIKPTNSEESIWLVGIGDEFTKHAQPVKAFQGVTTKYPKIVFMHDPAALFQVKEKFDLALAGHMHGGQIFIPGFGAIITPGDAPKSWAQGWVDFPLGSVFVSKGIGTSIFPVRINAPPEFVIMDLN